MIRGASVAALGCVLLLGCAGSSATTVERLRSPETAALGLPFADAVRVGDLIFVSGQVGNRPGTLQLVPGGVQAETRQVIANLERILAQHGSGLDRVVKCTVFLVDIAEWPAVNEVYRAAFGGALPARSAVAGSGLALGARVEIEAIAVAGPPN